MRVNISPRYIGAFLIVLSVALFFVILSFTQQIQNFNQYLHQDCNLPDLICPFKQDVPWQSAAGFSISAIIFAIGALLLITKPSEPPKIIKQAAPAKSKTKPAPASLHPDEKKIYETISAAGAIFQSELVEKSGMSKVKITRILDKLEASGLVERKRRGMTNVVMAKRD